VLKNEDKRLAIEAIIVPPPADPVHTGTYLNALSDTQWSELREGRALTRYGTASPSLR